MSVTTPDARSTTPVGVVLMTYGSARTPSVADVEEYMRSVYRGKQPPGDIVQEFARRYELVGGSPLVAITGAQGTALEALLNERHGPGSHRVEVGMLHSEPRITDAVAKLVADGCQRVHAVVLAPQYSPFIMGGYPRAAAAAAAETGAEVIVAEPWHQVPGYVDSLSQRVQEALDRYGRLPVIFTAHSLPEEVVKRDPAYLQQLHETIDAVVRRLDLAEDTWQFAYQSAGHSPEEWLSPDLKDLLPGLRADGHEGVLVVPIQFLADHLEILYDIDVAAREEAEEEGLVFRRIELPNVSPAFVEALAQVVEREERVLASRG